MGQTENQAPLRSASSDGARPVRRAIQHQIENPLAQQILAGDFASGDTIEVDVADGRFVFT